MIDTRQLYLLPWTRDDNPNGWIEPTTYCQLQCPFCYRGLDRDGFRPAHEDLAEMKRQVDDLVTRRRVRTVSIAGGEPLVYPHLDELIAHVRSRGAEAMLVTNGIRLDEKLVRHLRDLGVARVVIHVDRHQGRKGVATEADAIRVRTRYCELFRRVPGISLGFIQPLGPEDLDGVGELLDFFKRNADVVELVAFTRLQPLDIDGYPADKTVSGAAMFERVGEEYGIGFSAYLGKTHSEGISWLFGQAIFSGTELIGSLDADAFRFVQEEHRRRTGQYLHCGKDRRLTPGFLLRVPFNRSLRRLAWGWLRAGGWRRKLNLQLLLLIATPTKVAPGEYDCCLGCPDAMYHDGELVPSCLLELIKGGERIVAA